MAEKPPSFDDTTPVDEVPSFEDTTPIGEEPLKKKEPSTNTQGGSGVPLDVYGKKPKQPVSKAPLDSKPSGGFKFEWQDSKLPHPKTPSVTNTPVSVTASSSFITGPTADTKTHAELEEENNQRWEETPVGNITGVQEVKPEDDVLTISNELSGNKPYTHVVQKYLETLKNEDAGRFEEIKTNVPLMGDIAKYNLITESLNWDANKSVFDLSVYKNRGYGDLAQSLEEKDAKLKEVSEKYKPLFQEIDTLEKQIQGLEIQINGTSDPILRDEMMKQYQEVVGKYEELVPQIQQGVDEIAPLENDFKSFVDQNKDALKKWYDASNKLTQISLDQQKNLIDHPDAFKKDLKQQTANQENGILTEVGGNIWNSLVDLGVGTIETMKDHNLWMVSTPLKLASDLGFDANQETGLNQVADNMKNWTELYVKTPVKNTALFSGGKIDWSKLPGTIARTATDMATLLIGANKFQQGFKALKNVGAIPEQMGLYTASYIQTFDDYKKMAKDYGYSEKDAIYFAQLSAGLTSLLEGISPNAKIRGSIQEKAAFDNVFDATKKLTPETAYKKFFDLLVKEPGKEITQEFVQGFGDKLMGYFTNVLNSGDSTKMQMEDKTQMDEVYETALVTFITTALIGGGANTRNAERNSALMYAAENFEKFNNALYKQVNDGTLEKDVADKINAEVVNTLQVMKKIPDFDVTPEKKVQLIPLLSEKMSLEEQKSAADKVFSETFDNKIDAIDEKIKTILNKKDDSTDKEGVQSDLGEGQEPLQTQSEPVSGQEEIKTSGVVSGPSQDEINTYIESRLPEFKKELGADYNADFENVYRGAIEAEFRRKYKPKPPLIEDLEKDFEPETEVEEEGQKTINFAKTSPKQKKINDVYGDISVYNDLNENERKASDGLQTRNKIETAARDMGFTVHSKGNEGLVLKNENGRIIRPYYASTTNRSEAKDFVPLKDKPKEVQSLFDSMNEVGALGFPTILGSDGKRMSKKQLQAAIYDAANDIPSKGAKELIDQLEKMQSEDGIIVYDKDLGEFSVPIEQYLESIKDINEPSESDLSDEEIGPLAKEFDNYFNSLTVEDQYEAAKYLNQSISERKGDGNAENKGDQETVQPTGRKETPAGKSKEVKPPQESEQEGPGKHKRKISERIVESAKVPESVKKGLKEKGIYYTPKAVALTVEEANNLFEVYKESEGLDALENNLLSSDSGIQDDVKNVLMLKLGQHYAEEASKAEDPTEYERLVDKAVDISDAAAKFNTEKGRAVNAAKVWKQFLGTLPGGAAKSVQKDYDKRNEKILQDKLPMIASAKEAIDAFIKSPEFERLISLKIEEKGEELFGKEKKKKVVDFFDTIKIKQEPGKLYSNPFGVLIPAWNLGVEAMKQAVLLGGTTAQAIQAGIKKIDEYMKKAAERGHIASPEWDKKGFEMDMKPQIEKLVPKKRKLNPKTEEELRKAFLEKYSEKLGDLDDKKVRQLLRDVFSEVVSKKALSDVEFNRLFAKTMGLQHLTEEDKGRLEQLQNTINDVEKIQKEYINDQSEENKKKFIKALYNGRKAAGELNEFFGPRRNALELASTFIQGKLLTSASLAANVGSNIIYQPFFRMPTSAVGTILDYMFTYLGKTAMLSKYQIGQPTINIAYAQRGWFNGFGYGTVEGIKQLKSGALPEDYQNRDAYKGLHPGEAMLRFYEQLTNKEKRRVGLMALDLFEGLIGFDAEIMFRLLNLGDKPFRRAAETARLREIGKLKKLEGKKLEAFMLSPDPESAEQALIAGLKATFQQDNIISKNTSKIFSVDSLDSKTKAGRIAKGVLKLLTVANFPYIKTPVNMGAVLIETMMPELSFAIGVNHAAKGNRRDAILAFSRGVVNYAWGQAIVALFNSGVITGDADEEEDRRVKNAKFAYMDPNSFNMTALVRFMSGEANTKYRESDLVISYNKLGIAGMMMGGYAKVLKDKKPEELQGLGYFSFFLGRGISGIQSFTEQSFLVNFNGLLEALTKGGFERDKYIVNTMNALTASVVPNTLTLVSRAQPDFRKELSGKTLEEKLELNFKNRFFMTDEIPDKINVWGDPIPNVPAGANKYLYYLLDFSRTHTYELTFGHEVWELYQKTNDPDVFPYPPGGKVTVGGETIELTTEQHQLYKKTVGARRKELLAGYLEGDWKDHTDEERISNLKYIYSSGQTIGKNEFLNKSGLKIEEKVKKNRPRRGKLKSDVRRMKREVE